jgi:hypothetical protein
MSFTLSVRWTCPSDHLEIEGKFTPGCRPDWTVGESVSEIFEIDSADWSNGTRYHVFDARSDTELHSRNVGFTCAI